MLVPFPLNLNLQPQEITPISIKSPFPCKIHSFRTRSLFSFCKWPSSTSGINPVQWFQFNNKERWRLWKANAAPRLELFFYYIFRNNPAEIVLFSNSRRHTQSPFLLSSRVRLNHALNLYSRYVLGACSRYLYLNTSPITWSATELCWSLMSDEDEWMASQ